MSEYLDQFTTARCPRNVLSARVYRHGPLDPADRAAIEAEGYKLSGTFDAEADNYFAMTPNEIRRRKAAGRYEDRWEPDIKIIRSVADGRQGALRRAAEYQAASNERARRRDSGDFD